MGKGVKKFSDQAEKLHGRRKSGSGPGGKKAIRLVKIGFFDAVNMKSGGCSNEFSDKLWRLARA